MTSSESGQPGRVFPSFLPGGRHLLYHAYVPGDDWPGIYVMATDGTGEKRLTGADSGAVYDPASRHLLFMRDGTLLVQPFDLDALQLADEPFPIAEKVEASSIPGALTFSVSNSGALAYGAGGGSIRGLQLVWVDRQGKVQGPVGAEGNYRGIDLAPNGTRVAAHRHDGTGGDIWITDTLRGVTTRCTFDATQEHGSPIWSPDGSEIAYSSQRQGRYGLYKRRADNTSSEERLLEANAPVPPTSWSPDGRMLVYAMVADKGVPDLFGLPLTGERKPHPLCATGFSESHGQVSADGKWLAFQSNESGRQEIYVRPFPKGDGKWQVSTAGGGFPRWNSNSRELFYHSTGPATQSGQLLGAAGGELMAVAIRATDGGALEVGVPQPLFTTGLVLHPHPSGGVYHPYAVSSDGQRFLLARPAAAAGPDAPPPPVVVVLNWFRAVVR